MPIRIYTQVRVEVIDEDVEVLKEICDRARRFELASKRWHLGSSMLGEFFYPGPRYPTDEQIQKFIKKVAKA